MDKTATLKEVATERIRWNDEEAARPGQHPGRTLNRRGSIGSMSISSVHSRREISPAVALPVQYRTVSIQIDESKGNEATTHQRAKDAATKDISSLEWHTISTDEVLRRLGSSMKEGMSTDQVCRKVKEFGHNAPSPPESHNIKQVLGYFFKGFGPILLVGCILVFVSWKPLGEPPALANLALAIVLLAVFLIQAAFNAYQDWSSSRVMSSIKNMLPENSLVIRESKQISIPARDLVPGDIVCVKAGDKLPADLRFIQATSDAKFDRSILTGESVPLAATVDCTDNNYLETRNIGLQGTHCISGNCIGLVVSTGDRTVFGRIAQLTNEPKQSMTTLEKEVMFFVVIICSIMLTVIAVVLIVWGSWTRVAHPGWINIPTLIVDCVSVAIAFIPEGLPIALTAGLTITANLMRENKILCKSLKTVETLGAVSVICSDKTGTLTENRMTVTECTIGTGSLTVDEAEAKVADSSTAESPSSLSAAIHQLRAIAGLCNASEFDAATLAEPIERRRIYGDATDQAILRFSERLGPVNQLRQCWQKTYELAFNSKNKYMIRVFSLFKQEALGQTLSEAEADVFQTGDILLTIKGAPDVLIDRCSQYITDSGNARTFTQDTKLVFEKMKNSYSSQGKRCILLARKVVPRIRVRNQPGTSQFEDEMDDQARSGLTLVGLVAIVDPLRPDIRSVVSTLRGAGIRIFMVTGDFALTALAIAQDAGIISQPPPRVHTIAHLHREPPSNENHEDLVKPQLPRTSIILSGPELITLNEYQWSVLTTYEEIVFARTTPEQKLRIVKEFQVNDVVGMTGDGVNDAPSLKAADIGIAMGSGSDIAIEAADMVLLENFGSVVDAVQYGRVVFDNLKKVICYLLPAGSFAEFWPVFMNVIFGLPQILSSFLMIIICCFTDCAAATVLSYEKPEADVLLRKPRNVKTDRLVNWQLIVHAYGVLGIIETIASFAMAFWYLERNGIPFDILIWSYGDLPDWIDPDWYAQKVNEASSIYFCNLVVMQWFNVMATRTRHWSIFQHPPAFNKKTQNIYLFPAIVFALAMIFLWNYIPQLNDILGTARIPWEFYFLPLTFGIFILLLDESRKFFVRRSPKSIIAKMAW